MNGPIAVALAGPPEPPLARLLHLLQQRWPVEPALLAEGRVALVHEEGAELPVRPDVPLVAVVRTPAAAADARARGAALVLAHPGSEAAGLERPLPAGEGYPAARPVSPFVRARLRALRGRPDDVAVGGDDGWSGSPQTAPAVLATGCALVEALAWGAPTVTDADSAAAAGAVPGRDVVVAGPGRGPAAARLLPWRPARCAQLSWAGRRCYEARHDPQRLAFEVFAALGLHRSSPRRPYQRLEHVVEELGAGPQVRERVYQRASGSLPAVALREVS